MANNLFEPFHRSYRLSLILAVLLGGFVIFSYNLWRDLQECRQEAQQCCTQVDELENQMTYLQVENRTLSEKYQNALHEEEILQNKVINLESQIGDLTEKLEQAVNQNSIDQIKNNELKTELAEKQADLSDLQNERQQMMAKIKTLEIQVSADRALSGAAAWLSRHWQVTSALLFAGLVTPAALVSRKVQKNHAREGVSHHQSQKTAGSIWMLVNRCEAQAVSKLRRTQ